MEAQLRGRLRPLDSKGVDVGASPKRKVSAFDEEEADSEVEPSMLCQERCAVGGAV